MPQHGNNVLGMQPSQIRRTIAGCVAWSLRLRQRLATELLVRNICQTSINYITMEQVHWALRDGLPQRLKALRIPGLRRRTRLETLLFRIWFLIG